ncbi:MAG: Protein of unknown function (DUF2975) [Porphyrobacter sp. HL-46]|nr:MAG: Protein of unknown function (DUF2975) [Porphyrobacter sp. HL-46]
MNLPGNDLLLLAGKIIAILLQAIMALGAAAVAIAVPFVTILTGDWVEGFADGSGIPVGQVPALPLVGVLLVTLAILVAMFFFFGKLRAIIDTVGAGDPFAPANSQRLNMMAWLLLAAQLLTWPLIELTIYLADLANELEGVSIAAELNGFDITGVLMVLILFILARVFRHGAAMREDLEGTV